MSQPNIVLIIADQHRWDFVGWESNGLTHTPNLDRLAKAGTLFRSAYTTCPLCCPARQAIASGRYGVSTGCFTNLHQLPPGTPSFVSQLRAAGYHTVAVGKTHMEIHAYDSDLTGDAHAELMDSLGWDEICEISGNGMLRTGIRCAYSEFLREHGVLDDVVRFYEHWHYFMEKEQGGDPSFVCHEWPLGERFQETPFVGRRAVEWLQERDRSQPFFLHVGFAAPHSPIEPAPEYMDLYREADETAPVGSANTPEWLPDGRRGYRAMITQIDHYVGWIVDTLIEQGDADDTVLVYTADHGEMAGDHGRFGKTCFYEASERVPLLMAGPGIQPGQDSAALVEIIDLGKTLCELCGVEPGEGFYDYFGAPVALVGRVGRTDFESFAESVRTRLQRPFLTLHKHRPHVEQVAVVAGGGDLPDLLEMAHQRGCDTLLTGTVENRFDVPVLQELNRKFHELNKKLELNLIGGTHFGTERPAMIRVVGMFNGYGVQIPVGLGNAIFTPTMSSSHRKSRDSIATKNAKKRVSGAWTVNEFSMSIYVLRWPPFRIAIGNWRPIRMKFMIF